ncbi:hypothetical protein ACEPAH_7935 [Sanghuangporus vaninii]
MLTLLCTAPNSSVGSPIEGTNVNSSFSHMPSPPPPPLSGGACSSFAAAAATAGPSSSPTTPTRKLSLRRPSIRKRIQSLSRASGASLDKATSTLSNAASRSAFSFFRHASQGSSSSGFSSSGSSSLSSSAGNTSASMSGSASGPTTGSGSVHTRGASTSSFASGKSTKSASGSSGHGRRLNILNISAPSAFKHQFHLGTNTRTSDGPWDEMRWRQVIEMRETDQDDTLVIDVVPPTASSAVAELSRESSSSERNVTFSHTHSRSQSQSRTEQPSASLSSPNLLQIATSVFTSNTSSSSASPASANTSTPTPSSSTDTPPDESADKTKRQAKRASLVKRKPVPPLYPEEMEPMPTATSNPARSSIPAQATYVLMPDPAPGQSHQVPETAPAGKTSFEAREPEVSREVAQKETLAKLERAATVKEKSKKESTSTSTTTPGLTQTPVQNAPEHICILHSAPAPKPPPRRHTLAHMQARALGRGMCDAPSLPSVPASEVKPTISQEKEKERKKSRARPVPIVAPSPAPDIVDVETPVVTSVTSPILPPGLPAVTGSGEEKDENPKEVQEEPTKRSEALPTITNNSPRPSISSLDSTSSSCEGSETARSASCSSSSSSGDLDLDLEPRTPTDEKRVSAGSASSIKRLTVTPNNRRVRIVVSGGPLGEDSDEEDRDEDGLSVETPRTLRRASKRPNPPARRVEANEESVYVTADEAEDM